MLDPWLKYGYEIVITQDSSPSLRWLGSDTQETMHHRGGAYAETQLIYGNVVRDVLQRIPSSKTVSIMSVGLGLGYNEILVAIEAIRHNRIADIFLRSYEVDKNLVDFFVDWLKAGAQNETQKVYDQIIQHFDLKREMLGSVMLEWLNNGQWQILDGLMPEFLRDRKFNCYLYDAFSSKTSPHLWQEEFLIELLKSTADEQCQLSTYACTGPLKRALKATGFVVKLRDGFASKRNSTLGLKGFVLEENSPG